ncbi:MAG TPA: hypothetical protein VN856_00585 [Mycobacterium sp.]|uniref:hypothetical protein n=1 Tax=Mycobacterium sp. TaxID=1785 RepID=UPI002D01CC09|nr:hypothetical protein [Mycobacterium sp.]HXO78366.1 hypothetical protein [Mycobacterium sp.]
MTNLDPQTTGDFWDAYLRAAGAGTKLAQVSRTVPDDPQKRRSPVSGPVSYVPRIARAPITFAWDLVVLRRPIAAGAPPKAA